MFLGIEHCLQITAVYYAITVYVSDFKCFVNNVTSGTRRGLEINRMNAVLMLREEIHYTLHVCQIG